MKKLIGFYIISLLLYGCTIEDEYNWRKHPLEHGLVVNIDGDFNKPANIRMLLYNNQNELIKDTIVLVESQSTEVVFDVMYGKYNLTCYDVSSTLISSKEEIFDECYFYVPTKKDNDDFDNSLLLYPEGTERPIDDSHIFINHTSIYYDNVNTDEIVNVRINKVSKRINLSLNFTGRNFEINQIVSTKACIHGLATVLSNDDCSILQGNPGYMSFKILSESPEGFPTSFNISRSEGKKMYSSFYILGNDLHSGNDILSNTVMLRFILADGNPIMFSCDLTNILNIEKDTYNIGIKIDMDDIAGVGSNGSVDIDESWDEDEINFPI